MTAFRMMGWVLTCIGALTLVGCNAIYFYESDKISLTLEARPDPAAPVQGNLGMKQRVAAVVPPKSTDGELPNDDCLSLLYSFVFEKHDTDGDPIVIRTALLSGEAAIAAGNGRTDGPTEGDLQKAAKAIAGTPRFSSPQEAELQLLLDQVQALDDARAAEVLRDAATIIGGEFNPAFTNRATNLKPRVAFLATKNEYLGEELHAGDGPRYRTLIEALRQGLAR